MDHATSSRLPPRPSQQPHTLISPPATPSSSSAPMTAAVGHDADSSNDASGGRVELHLVSPLNYSDIPPPVINAKRKHTIRRIKAAVRDHWPGKPDVSGIRLIHAGRILRDDEVVGDVVTADGTQAYLHLVVRPDSWTDWSKAPVTPGRRGPRAITPAATLRPAVDPLEGSSYFALPRAADSSSHAAAPLTPMVALQSHAILPDWAKLPESPRVLALLYELYFIRYTYLYAVQVAGIDEAQAASQRRQSEASLGNISPSAHQALSDIEALVFKQPPVVAGSPNEMQQVYERTQILLRAVAECSQLGLATTMPPPWAFQASPPLLQPQAPAPEPAIPPPTLSELIRIFLPVLFLAIKLAILLYIFTRGQSVTKRTAMCAASAAWIVWEVAAIWRRRQRRARAEIRRAQQPQAQQQPAPTTRPTSSRRHRRQRTASTTAAAAAWTHPLAPSAPHRRLARSFATNPSKYIAQRLAYLGLEAEDRSMGFRPYDDAQAQRWAVAMLQGRAPLPAPRRAQRQQQLGWLRRLASLPGEALSWVRWLLLEPTTLALPLYLYVLTLFPRLEELRADELRRRDRVLARWWSGRARAWVEERRRERRRSSGEAGADEDAAATNLAEVPRLLLHPYVLRYLKLREDEDGLVSPLDGSEGGAVGGIDVQEEIEAQRRAARGGNVGGLRRRRRQREAAAAAAAEGGPEAPAATPAATAPTPATGEGEEGARAENEEPPAAAAGAAAAAAAAAAAEEEEMATSSTEDEEDEEEVEEEEEVEVDEDMGFF